MRKGLFILIAFLLYNMADAQSISREESNMPVISEVKASLTNAKGWTLQDNGNWVSGNNTIPIRNSEINANSDKYAKLGLQNFETLELREVIIGGVQYVILCVFYSDGNYEFELLKEDWHKYQSMSYYVFEAKMLQEILPDSLELNVPYSVNLNAFLMGEIKDYDKKTYLSIIGNSILKAYGGKISSQKTAIFAVLPVNTGKNTLIRFRLIDVFNKKDIWGPYLKPENEQKLFTRRYFELPFKRFSEFIRGIQYYPNLIADANSYEDFLHRGISRYNREEYSEAIKDFAKAIELEPETENFLIYAYLGSCFFQMENYTDAESRFSTAILLRPTNSSFLDEWAKTYYNRGLARLKRKNKEEACEDFNMAADYGVNEAALMLKRKCSKWLKRNNR